MPVKIHNKEYFTVAERIKMFRAEYPEYGVLTELLQVDDTRVVVQATIRDKDGFTLSQGLAEEQWATSRITKTSAVEVCETSAVGRALAFYKYAGDEIASADEVANAVGGTVTDKIVDAFDSQKSKVWELQNRLGIHKKEAKADLIDIIGKDTSKFTEKDWDKCIEVYTDKLDSNDPANDFERHTA